MAPVCTVCALFYGDYPDLMERCLSPLLKLDPMTYRLRLGANQLSERSYKLLHDRLAQADPDLLDYILVQLDNQKKYPVMRKLLNGGDHSMQAVRPIVTEWTMWFDDDSSVSDPDPNTRLNTILSDAVYANADMVGSIWTMKLTDAQMEWVKKQTWFQGRPVDRNVAFCTGGLWAIRTHILHDNQWPPRDALHRGGDVMLGQLLYQNKLKMVNFKSKSGLLINADETGKESSSKRRGFDSEPLGSTYANRPKPVDRP